MYLTEERGLVVDARRRIAAPIKQQQTVHPKGMRHVGAHTERLPTDWLQLLCAERVQRVVVRQGTSPITSPILPSPNRSFFVCCVV